MSKEKIGKNHFEVYLTKNKAMIIVNKQALPAS